MAQHVEHGILGRAMTVAADGIPVVLPGEDELPYSDGVPMETYRHFQQMMLLLLSLRRAWAGRNYFAAGDMFIYYSKHQIKKNDFRGPDVFVVLDTSNRERKSWVAWHEGKLPDVVIELTSSTTRHIDRGEKMHIYSRIWKVAHYYLFDPFSLELEGYTLDENESFVPIQPCENGDLPCPHLGLALGIRPGEFDGVEAPWLRWLDATGQPLLTSEEDAERALTRLETERERAEVERERADAAERRVRELEAELRSKAR